MLIAQNDQEHMVQICEDVARSYFNKYRKELFRSHTFEIEDISDILRRIMQYLFYQVPHLEKYIYTEELV